MSHANRPDPQLRTRGLDEALAEFDERAQRLRVRMAQLADSLATLHPGAGAHVPGGPPRMYEEPPGLGPPAPAPRPERPPPAPRPQPAPPAPRQGPPAPVTPIDRAPSSGPPPREPAASAPRPPSDSAAVPSRWMLGEAGRPSISRHFEELAGDEHRDRPGDEDRDADAGRGPARLTVCFEPVADFTELSRLEDRLASFASIDEAHVRRIGHGRATIELQTAGAGPLRSELLSSGTAHELMDRGEFWHVRLEPTD